jgi:hypothetical protein
MTPAELPSLDDYKSIREKENISVEQPRVQDDHGRATGAGVFPGAELSRARKKP